MSPAYLGFAIEPSEKRYLHYKGVGILFARPSGGSFMQPSIDTLLVCHALVRLFHKFNISTRRAIDVGCGSGFIGKFAAAYAPGDGELSMTLCDVDPAAKEYCLSAGFNAFETSLIGRSVSWRAVVGDGVKLLERDQQGYDLILSNPPYIPTREEVNGAAGLNARRGFWEGTGLLLYLINLMLDGRCLGGAHLVIALTSLTLKSPGVRDLLEAAPAKGVCVTILEEREIGWKAFYAGPSSTGHLLATSSERITKQRIGECEFWVGATRSGQKRFESKGCDSDHGFHWHVAYVLDFHRPN